MKRKIKFVLLQLFSKKNFVKLPVVVATTGRKYEMSTYCFHGASVVVVCPSLQFSYGNPFHINKEYELTFFLSSGEQIEQVSRLEIIDFDFKINSFLLTFDAQKDLLAKVENITV